MPDPRVALLVIGDGRGFKDAAVESFRVNAIGLNVVTTVEVDDSAHELGFCGAWAAGWRALRGRPGFDYVFGLEEDFTFLRPFRGDVMALILRFNPRIAQVALKRGPHGEAEEAVGGFMEMWPAAYTRNIFEIRGDCEHEWMSQRLFWTSNPHLCRADLILDDWPPPPRCEQAFTNRMLARNMEFAYLGGLTDPPLVEHVGTRTGTGY